MIDTLLLQPPALIPSEPPLSLAILYSALHKAQISTYVLDANLDAYLYLLDAKRLTKLAGENPKTSIHRALKHRQQSLDRLQLSPDKLSFPHYSTAVRYLNLLLSLWTKNNSGERLTLGDYQHKGYSVFNPEDLKLFAEGTVQTLFHPFFQDQLLRQIEVHCPRKVAISINYLHQVFPAFELAGMLRQQFPKMKLLVGGGLISSWKEPLQQLDIKLPPFDHVIFGPGEATLVALTQNSAPNEYYLSDPSTISYRPDFSFANVDRYFSPQPILPLSTSRGCYWQRCLFCPEATAPVHPYGSLPSPEVPDLLLHLSKLSGVQIFHLTDNAIPVNILKKLAERRTDLKELSWFGFVRFEAALENFELIEQLSHSGCRMLQLGLESGSQQVLDRLGKGIKLESVEKILDNLYRCGICAYIYIMLGTPDETEADAERTLTFLEKHVEKIGFLNISIMNLPRGSELLDNPALYGIDTSQLQDTTSPLGLYHEFRPVSGWDRTAARKFLNQRLLKSPTLKKIINRDPPLFSSNHAFFFAPEGIKR